MSANISICRSGQATAFRIEGRATLKSSPAVRRIAEECLQCESAQLLFDLQQCSYMDSTFVGTLLFLHRQSRKCDAVELALVCPSADCQRLLKQLRIDRLFSTCTAEELPSGPWNDLDQTEGEGSQFQQVVVQAHRQLADLPGDAGEPFRALAERLEAEAAAGETR